MWWIGYVYSGTDWMTIADMMILYTAYNSQAGLTPTMPKNNVYLTAEDVDYNINTDDLCGAPTRGM